MTKQAARAATVSSVSPAGAPARSPAAGRSPQARAGEAPVTLITGTSRGIGRYLAEHYTALGHRVVGCSRSQPDWDMEGYCHHVVDVSEEPAVKRLFDALRTEYGRVDNLVNNAGIASMNHALLTPVETVQRILTTNVVGSFLFCREAARLMHAQRYGRIVNFSTVALPLRLEGESAYVTSKAGVVAMSQVLARELGPFGITVNVVGPGPVETDLIAGVPREKIDAVIARQAIPRRATFADVANVVDFLVRAESSLVTGQTIYLGGV